MRNGQMPRSAACISVRGPNGMRQTIQIGREVVTVGRSSENTINLDDRKASRKHLEIHRGPDGQYFVRDLDSMNGTLLNGIMVRESPLTFGDVIGLGEHLLVFESPMMDDYDAGIENSTMLPRAHAAEPSVGMGEELGGSLDLRETMRASIGRARDSDLVLDHPLISRHHAHVRRDGDGFVIVDLNSTNGVYVNGAQVKQGVLTENATVQIGPYRFVYAQGIMRLLHDHLRLDVVHVIQQVSSGVRLLNDVSCSILPREFVCIVGGSGAGKSTFLDAMSGVRPASHGQVLYNGTDYYAHMDEFRSQMGYVPQDDIVPLYLTVAEALTYAARLRLPHDTLPAEISARVEQVMHDLDLAQRRDVLIVQLSGGQRKRVSIGVELLTEPTLFFLDEPTSGLDPSLEAEMMAMLRRIADQDRTVILVTHATQNITLCDKLIFLAPGGYLGFYGAPHEALTFFDVENFVDIYQLLKQPGAGQEWANRYLASPYCDRYVRDRLQRVARAQVRQQNTAPMPATVPDRKLQRAQMLSQFGTLTARYRTVVWRDRRNLLLLLLQAPIIGLLLAVVYGRNVFTAKTGVQGGREVVIGDWSRGNALQLTTMIVIVALWFGASNSAREIVKEANVYRRERMINLRLGPYLASKLVILMGLCLVQDVTMLGIIGLLTPYRFERTREVDAITGAWPKVLLVLLVISLAGVAMGLLASAMASNADRVTSVVPIILIPQILFSGMLIWIPNMPLVGKAVSGIIAGNWGMQAVGSVSGLSALIALPYADPRKQIGGTDSPYYIGVWPSVMILVALSVALLALTLVSLKRKDIGARYGRVVKSAASARRGT